MRGRPPKLKLSGDHPVGRQREPRVDPEPVAVHAVDKHEKCEGHGECDRPRELEPREKQRRDVKHYLHRRRARGRGSRKGGMHCDKTPVECTAGTAPGRDRPHQPGSEKEEGEPVLQHQSIDRAMHRSVWAAQRESGAQHRAECGVEHCDELKAHGGSGDTQVERLEPVRLVGRDVDLDDAVVGEARQQGRLRADGDAVLSVELQLLLSNLKQAHLQIGLERALIRVQHACAAPTPELRRPRGAG
mmetsp:Transcript_11027/g.35446  ORF Transcript_11027/g.35446 Transcript_11027/m.35446 type:complete len:245 (-) Transcript_11027:23-757(-)|eukprot:scaffold12190_cov120-Isochrysis_galbana.AAC.6